MNIELIFNIVETVGIISALVYTAKQNYSLEKEMKLQAYNTTVDRIHQIRTLLIQDPDLHKVWEGGIEGNVLKDISCYKHFYLIKMILHMNESLYLKIQKDSNKKNQDLLTPFRENLKTDLTATEFRRVWKNNRIVRESYDFDFRNEINLIIKEIEIGDIDKN